MLRLGQPGHREAADDRTVGFALFQHRLQPREVAVQALAHLRQIAQLQVIGADVAVDQFVWRLAPFVQDQGEIQQ